MMPPFSKLLIANRGEIALRIAQTCAEMGIKTVAVYSEADRGSPHVLGADESYCIGPAPSTESYLNIETIIRTALRSGAEAIHPGYGFLSENPEFAEACRKAGIVFVGPTPEAMRLLGSKQAAKRLARDSGVPVLPGYDGDEQSAEALAAQAEKLGFPLLIKASAGGGGRGMRIVRSIEHFPGELESARREAISAFGDGTVLLERYIENPRHVEFQVLADAYGSVIHLGERECSIQRRHQKIIEESPSAALTQEMREEMGAAAVRLTSAAGYVNAGTVEFVMDPDGSYHFLEVNTRLQVEHPVTEMVTGLDLVREQIRIAGGLPLSHAQNEVRFQGHAIECRVYAEDPDNDFLPSTGELLLFEPARGVGIRNDSGVRTGTRVTPYYDPLLTKLITYAGDRNDCISRTANALSRYTVLGVTTNLPLLRAVIGSSEFREAEISTTFLDHNLKTLLPPPAHLDEDALIAAAAEALLTPHPIPRDPWRSALWRHAGAEVVQSFVYANEEYTVASVHTGPATWSFRTGQLLRVLEVERVGDSTLAFTEDSRTWRASVARDRESIYMEAHGHAYTLGRPAGLNVDALGQAGSTAGVGGLEAPMPGTIVKVNVGEGERVEAGETLLVIEAMKMEHAIKAPHAGTVKHVRYTEGDPVQAGAVLVEIGE